MKNSRVNKILITILLVLGVIWLIKILFGDYVSSVVAAANMVLIPASVAIFLTYVLMPVNKLFRSKLKRPGLAAMITVVSFLVIFILILGALVAFVVINALDIFKEMQTTGVISGENIQVFVEFLKDYIGLVVPDGTVDIVEIIRLNVGPLLEVGLPFISKATSIVVMLVMAPVFLYFFLKDGGNIYDSIIRVVPDRIQKDVSVIAESAGDSTGKYLRGKAISIGILSLSFSLMFSIFFIIILGIENYSPNFFWWGLLYGVFFGIVMGTLDIIPYVGPLLGLALPISFILLFKYDDFTLALIYIGIVIGINFIIQGFQADIIEPLIMSKEVEVHPLAIFSGLLFFGVLFGVVGIILATPIVATIKSVYTHYKYKNLQLKE